MLLESNMRRERAGGGMSRRIKTKELARYIVMVVEGAIMQGRTLGDAASLRRQFACSKEYLKNRPRP
jgi:hypothetical protein